MSGQDSLHIDSNLRIIFAVTLMAVMGVASITPAFPKIIQELSVPTEAIGLLIIAFTIPGVILTLVFGVLADRIGRKKVLVPALLLFGVAGGLCALVRDFNLLLALRFFQGVGAASLGSLNVTLIGDLFSGEKRKAAMAYNASVLSVGTAIYPAIGGALASLEWYYPFALPVVSIPIGLLVLFFLESPEPERSQPFNSYIIDAWRSIKDRRVIILFLASIATFIVLYGSYLTYLPILLDTSFGASALVIGLILSTVSLATAVMSLLIPRLVKVFSETRLLGLAFALYSLALFFIAIADGFWALLVSLLIFGIAHGINIPCIHSLLARLAPMEHRAAIMSLNGMVLRLGQTIGPLLMGFAFVLWGIGTPFVTGAIVCISMVPLIAVMEWSNKPQKGSIGGRWQDTMDDGMTTESNGTE
ncbi:MAG: MFS transporter [Candidatus Thorarchaeota archaeon]